jgi:DnaJ-class molecular chaperone
VKKNLYEILGVAPDADADTIRDAYRKLARQYHPDVNPGDAASEERFKEISQAYATLSDAEKRSQYDEFGEVALEGGFRTSRESSRSATSTTCWGAPFRAPATHRRAGSRVPRAVPTCTPRSRWTSSMRRWGASSASASRDPAPTDR